MPGEEVSLGEERVGSSGGEVSLSASASASPSPPSPSLGRLGSESAVAGGWPRGGKSVVEEESSRHSRREDSMAPSRVDARDAEARKACQSSDWELTSGADATATTGADAGNRGSCWGQRTRGACLSRRAATLA
jgi:hypothetical protein